jgi:hypothetical protein
LALSVSLRAPGSPLVVPAYTVDVGLGGACCETGRELLACGTSLTVDIEAPTLWDPLRLPASVVWSQRATARKPARAGLRFEHHDATLLYALFELLGESSAPAAAAQPFGTGSGYVIVPTRSLRRFMISLPRRARAASRASTRRSAFFFIALSLSSA